MNWKQVHEIMDCYEQALTLDLVSKQ
jgi:hypothetical protein